VSAKEREWFERLNSSLNAYTPNKSHSECNRSYRSENRDKIKLIKKQYAYQNKFGHIKTKHNLKYIDSLVQTA
jgi:hypothetical protein